MVWTVNGNGRCFVRSGPIAVAGSAVAVSEELRCGAGCGEIHTIAWELARTFLEEAFKWEIHVPEKVMAGGESCAITILLVVQDEADFE